jgi:hypothetical protein
MVKINTLGNPDPLDVLHPYGFHDGVDRVLILEVLVKFAIAAKIVIGAGAKPDSLFEVVKTGTPVGGPFPEFVGPVYDRPASSGSRCSRQGALPVFLCQLPQGSIETAAIAIEGPAAILVLTTPACIQMQGPAMAFCC